MSVLGGALSAAGAVISGIASYQSAKKQMKYQERMSSTAIQRQMRDLRRAGLNPILAAKYGGASTPAGAGYTVPNIGAAAVQGYKDVSSAKQMQAQTRVADATVKKVEQETAYTEANVKKVLQETKFGEVLHNERWLRQFAGMSKENVVASVLAVMNGVDIDRTLRGMPLTVQDKANMGKFLRAVQKMTSDIGANIEGAMDKLPFISNSIAATKKFEENIMSALEYTWNTDIPEAWYKFLGYKK